MEPVDSKVNIYTNLLKHFPDMAVTSIRGRSLIPTILCKWLWVTGDRRGEGWGGKSRWMFCLLISLVSSSSRALPINLSVESLLLPPVHLILILRQSFKARLWKYLLEKLITRLTRPVTLIRTEHPASQPGFNHKIRSGMCWAGDVFYSLAWHPVFAC